MNTVHSLLLIILGNSLCLVNANTSPEFEFHLEIKTPQLIGIVAGVVVFTVTVGSVVYLLVQSGSWSKFVEEMQSGKPLVVHEATNGNSNRQAGKLLKDYPKLYDHLVEASNKLPPVIANVHIESDRLIVRNVDLSNGRSTKRPSYSRQRGKPKEGRFNDIDELFMACNGSAVYHESSYDPMRLWMWHESGRVVPNPNAVVPTTMEEVPLVGEDVIDFPIGSREEFAEFLRGRCSSVCACGGGAVSAPVSVLCIVDREFGRPVGMVDLVSNSPRNLTVQLGKVLGLV